MSDHPGSIARRLALINLATLCFSLVGVVRGMMPEVPSGPASWWRAVFAVGAVVVALVVGRVNPFRLKRMRDAGAMALMGVLISGNWYFFFEAIARSTVAVAVIALFTYPLMTALIEPILFRERYQWIDVLGAVTVMFGVYLVVPTFDASSGIVQGVIFGLISALSLSLANLLSRRMVRHYPPTVLMFHQFLVPVGLFLPFVLNAPQTLSLDVMTLGKVALLGAVLTTIAQLLFIRSLRHFSTSLASVLLSLQPFYTVLLAWWLVGEEPSERTISGGIVITATVIAVSAWHATRPKRAS